MKKVFVVMSLVGLFRVADKLQRAVIASATDLCPAQVRQDDFLSSDMAFILTERDGEALREGVNGNQCKKVMALARVSPERVGEVYTFALMLWETAAKQTRCIELSRDDMVERSRVDEIMSSMERVAYLGGADMYTHAGLMEALADSVDIQLIDSRTTVGSRRSSPMPLPAPAYA
jgi:hypothetical protein